MKPRSSIDLHFSAYLLAALMTIALPATAQKSQPQSGASNPAPSLPSGMSGRPSIDLQATPGAAGNTPALVPEGASAAFHEAAYEDARNRLVDQTIPIEDLVISMLERIEDEAAADLEDVLDEMAKNREERTALRAKRHHEHGEALELEQRRQKAMQDKRNAARHAARDARNESRHAAREAREARRDGLREARAAERHKRWVAREKARSERQALRRQHQAAREARREAREQQRRKSHLVASMISAMVDQFNAPEGPQPARIAIFLDQIDSQSAHLKPPPAETAEGTRKGEEFKALDRHFKSLREAWREFVETTDAGVRCTTCE